MSNRKRSKTEERSFARMLDDLEQQEADFERFKRTRSLIPAGWHSVERRAEIKPKKTKLNLALDADMVTWFRGRRRPGEYFQDRKRCAASRYSARLPPMSRVPSPDSVSL